MTEAEERLEILNFNYKVLKGEYRNLNNELRQIKKDYEQLLNKYEERYNLYCEKVAELEKLKKDYKQLLNKYEERYNLYCEKVKDKVELRNELDRTNRQLEEFKDKCKKLYNSYNVLILERDDLTFAITSEECAEVIQALSKIKRYGFDGDYKDNLICISELLSLGYVDVDKVEEWHTYKVNREIEKARERKEQKR